MPTPNHYSLYQRSKLWIPCCCGLGEKPYGKHNCKSKRVKKGKCHTLDIASLSEGISLQKRSGTARVLEGFYNFTCKPTRLSTNGMNHTCLCLPSRSWSSFTDSIGMEGWVGLGTTTVSKQSAQNRYVTAITAVSCWSRYASQDNWSTGDRGTHDLSGCKPRRYHWATESAS